MTITVQNQDKTQDQLADQKRLRKVTIAGGLGLFVEFYDYGIYGFLAGTISTVFFPGKGSTAALLMTYGIFALTFFMRPLGGLFFGSLADKIGRRAVLVTTLTLMTGATTAIGLLPTYETIGLGAPALLLCMRLLQGLSAGGEVASAMSFVGEHAPNNRRGFMMSWTQFGSFSALLTGILFAVTLNSNLSTAAMQSWGWRVPFLIAAPFGLIGYYIRVKLQDTPNFTRLRETNTVAAHPIREALSTRKSLVRIALAVGLPTLNSSGYYILFAYMPVYLSRELHFNQTQGLTVTGCALVAILFSIPAAAALSDRVGRKPVLLVSALGLAALAYPGFQLMTLGSVPAAILGAVMMAVLFAGHTSIIHAVLVELFPTRVRNTAYSIGFNICTAVFGGAAPLVMTALISSTQDVAIPAYYVIGTALVTAACVLALRETSRKALQE